MPQGSNRRQSPATKLLMLLDLIEHFDGTEDFRVKRARVSIEDPG